MSNPYRAAHAAIRRHRGASPGWPLPVLATALATPLARPVLLGFLDRGAVAVGVEAVSLRLGALVAAAMALHTYSDLVRGPDRAVLDPHPVQARPLLNAIALRTARERAYLPMMGAVLLLPVGLDGHWAAWAGGVAVVLGAWIAALGVGFTVHLASVWAAFSPALAAVLDFLRGDNPRMQAALIYAPGVALAVVGGGVALAAGGVGAALGGWAPGWAFLAAPLVLAAAGWALAGPLADAWYVRASALLAEVDAAWAMVDEGEEARRVYLEWLSRGDAELLRALRQGWRKLRSWPTGAWGLGAVGLFAGWSADPDAPTQVVAVVGGAVLLIAAVATRMAQEDPRWLDLALGVSPFRVGRARAISAFLYAQGAIVPPVAALLIRQGGAALSPLLWVEGLAAVGAVLAALFAARWRGRGALAYGPAAILLWGAVASLVGAVGVGPGGGG